MIAVVILNTAFILYWTKFRTHPTSATGVAISESGSASLLDPTAREIVFLRELIVDDSNVQVDGAAAEPVPCAETPQSFAKIKLDDETFAYLTCSTDPAAGIRMHYTGRDGEIRVKQLGLNETDVKDMSDSRSLISRKSETPLRIEYFTLLSSETSCTIDHHAEVWNASLKQFEETQNPREFTPARMSLPFNVYNHCLTVDGKWNAKTISE